MILAAVKNLLNIPPGSLGNLSHSSIITFLIPNVWNLCAILTIEPIVAYVTSPISFSPIAAEYILASPPKLMNLL